MTYRLRVDDMPAGRALDLLVAEKVMGWTGVHTGYAIGSAELQPLGMMPGGMDSRYPVPYYSTSIAAAWEVVVELQRRVGEWSERTSYFGAQFRLSHRDTRPERSECWEAGYAYVECYDEGFVLSSEAGTAPLAICRAALKATGITEV